MTLGELALGRKPVNWNRASGRPRLGAARPLPGLPGPPQGEKTSVVQAAYATVIPCWPNPGTDG